MKSCFKFPVRRVLTGCLSILAALIPALANAQSVPAISGFNPISGTIGTSINITGTNFNPVVSSNIVFFGAVRAAVLSASATNLLVTVPAGATYAPITVTVSGLTAYSGVPFLPTFPGSIQTNSVTWAPRLDLTSIVGMGATILADLDGDGKLDVITGAGGSDNIISIYRNISTNGSLTTDSFAPPVNLSWSSGVDGTLWAADVDGDGKLDLLLVDQTLNQVGILRNLSVPGALSFAPRINFSVGAGPRCVVVQDLDGDGKPEIIAASWGDSTVSVLRNIGSPGSLDTNSFAPAVAFPVGANPQTVAVADLDGDGHPDIVTANNYNGTANAVSILRNTSSPGTISLAPHVDLTGQATSFCVVIGDLDGDGKPDLVVSSFNAGQAVSVYRNISTAGSLTTNSFAPEVDFSLGGWGNTVALGDLDGDGKPDLAVVTQLSDHFSVFKNVSTPGSFTINSLAPRVDYPAGYNPNGVTIGDLDGDGRPEAVFSVTYGTTVSVYQNQTPFGGPVVCTPAPSGLVGWWQGEGNANDSTGTNHGTLSSTGVSFVPGEVGQGFHLDGTNGYVQIPDSDALKPANVTVEAWVWLDPNVNLGPSSEQIIFKRNSWTYLFEGYSLLKTGIDNGDGTYSNRFQFVVTRNGNQVIINSSTVVQRGVWYHVAATYDGNQSALFVNGAAEASAVAGFALDYGTRPVFIGTTGEPAPYTSMFAGIIDEASIYSRALSPNEIQAIYLAGNAGKCPLFTAPIITLQPTNQIVLAGGTAGFNAGASGTQPLSYQWIFNGTNILSGATSPGLTLTNVQPGQAGNYSLLVTNNYGSAMSSNAVLTVVVPAVPPTILSQTPNQVVLLSNTATFSVTVSGSEPLSYFWQRNGAPIFGATNSVYALNNVQLSDSGSQFNCIVTNAFGSAASTNVSLKVIDTMANDLCSGAIIITNTAYTNLQSTLKASSFGDPMPDCIADFGHGVWYQFTAPVAGRLIVDTFGSDFDTGLAVYTGSCDGLTEVACNDDTGGVTSQVILPTAAGVTYSILAGGYGSNAGNLVLHLNYLTLPAFTVQPTNQFVVVSSNASFTATVSGTQPISFQWYFNNTPLADGGRISGSTNTTLNLADIAISDAGNYQLVASNIVGVVTSSVAVLTPVILPPVFVQPPVDQSVLTGSNVTFTAVVDGTPPYSYQWSFNGSPLTDDGLHISGSATASLSVSNLTAADAGSYTLTVTNVSGSINGTAVLTVLFPPAITVQPAGRSVPPGLPTIFNAVVSGVPAPGYQWQLNGTNIPGATSSSYTNLAIGTNDLGFYHLIASNSVGVAVSADAQLTFGPVAAWGRNAAGECLPPPGLNNVVGIAGNFGASFAVRTDGSIAAWGSGAATNISASVSNVIAVSSSSAIANYALRSDGTVVGWAGPLPPVLSNIVSVAAQYNYSYALRAEGTLTNWGSIPFPGFPAGLNHLKAIACGFNNALALRSDGTVVVSGSGAVTNVPTGLSNVVAIAAGYTYAMALKANGTVVAWGSGTVTNLPAGMTNITAISAGNYAGENFGVAIRSNGNVVAWGDNPYGENSPPAALTNLTSVAIAAAPYHGLALVNDGSPVILHPPVGLTAYTGRSVTLQGSAVGAQPLSYQWLLNGTNIPGATNTSLILSNLQPGNAGNYQLFASNSLNTALSLPAPLTVISNNALTFLSVPTNQTNYQGGKMSLGVTVLGNGPLRYQWYFAATNFGSPSIYTAIPGGTNDTLVLDPALAINTGNYYVTISNQFGGIISLPAFQRVLFAKAWGYFPTDPPFNVTNATAIAAGNAGQTGGHYLVLKSDGKIASWSGSSVFYGETNVSALSNSIVTAIAAGYQDSLALKSDGTVFAWGYNPFGQTNVPAGLNGVTAIACGDFHDLALKSDGTIVGWGQNTYGQATNIIYSPGYGYFPVTNVVALAASGQDSMALHADGSVVTWGQYGSSQSIPVNVTNIVAIAAGTAHFLALRANGTVIGWGNNPYGQTTIPAGASNIVAISAAANHSVLLRNDGTVITLGAYAGSTSTTAPADLANVVAIASGGDHDLALFGTRAPSFTVHPWNRSVPLSVRTNITLTGKCAGVQPVYYQWQLNGTNVPGATNDTLILTNQPSPGQPVRLIPTGAYQLIASNAYGVVASKYAKITAFYPLSDALNTPTDGKGNPLYNWITSGSAQWFGETNISHDGVAAAQSGGIGALQETILQTTLVTNWSGRCTFWWKVSSEQDFDFLEFRVNGIVQTNISGEVNWQQVSIPVSTGTNVLMWRYSKDVSFDAGQDAGWVDQFAFVPDGPIILVQPVSQTVNMGTNVTFRVTAIGPTNIYPNILVYQWRHNGNLIGGSGPSLGLSNVGRAQNGTYSVTITNINLPNNSTVSSNAVLKVLVPQLLGTPVLLPDGTLQFTSTDANGGLLSPSDLANFEAQASTNLVDWVTLPNALSLTNGMLQLEDNSGTNWPARFYRLLEH